MQRKDMTFRVRRPRFKSWLSGTSCVMLAKLRIVSESDSFQIYKKELIIFFQFDNW
jgi:hypothetical protein